MDYLLLGFFSVVIIALLFALFVYSRRNKTAERLSMVTKEKSPVKCPLCNTQLFKGENIISKVYRPMDVPDQIMTISGCPHCYPVCEPGVKRICPVCHASVGVNQVLTARLFNKTTGKKHVHVVGCSSCRRGNPAQN